MMDIAVKAQLQSSTACCPWHGMGRRQGWWTWENVRGNKWQPASDAQASSFEAFQFGCCPLKHGPMGGVNLRVWGTGAGEVITPQSRLTATTPRSHKTTWWHSLTGASQSHKAATKTQNVVEFEYTKGTVDMLLTTTLLQHHSHEIPKHVVGVAHGST